LIHSPFDKRTDWLPSIVAGLFMFGTAVSSFYLTVYFKEDLAFTGNQIGIIFALQAITGVLAAFPAGLGNDRVTSRTLLGIGLFCLAVGFALMAQVRTFLLTTVIFFAWGLANNLCKLSMDVQIFKTDRGTHTERRVSLYQTWRFAGLTVGTVLTGYLISLVDFRIALMVVAFICLLLILLALPLEKTPVGKVKLSEYRADLSNPRVLFFAFWMFLFTMHWGAEGTCYPLFLRKDLGLSKTGLGWYMGAEYLMVIVGVWTATRRSFQAVRMRHWAILGLVCSGFGHIGMVFGPVPVSLGFRMLHGFGDGIMMVILFFGIFRLFSLERLGGNAGFINMMTMAGYVTGSLLYGPAGERFGYSFPLWVSGALTLLLTLPLLIKRYRGMTEIG
jgi:predicted MFS family arabinose efflux permease